MVGSSLPGADQNIHSLRKVAHVATQRPKHHVVDPEHPLHLYSRHLPPRHSCKTHSHKTSVTLRRDTSAGLRTRVGPAAPCAAPCAAPSAAMGQHHHGAFCPICLSRRSIHFSWGQVLLGPSPFGSVAPPSPYGSVAPFGSVAPPLERYSEE